MYIYTHIYIQENPVPHDFQPQVLPPIRGIYPKEGNKVYLCLYKCMHIYKSKYLYTHAHMYMYL
jgi:hypothetical protein